MDVSHFFKVELIIPAHLTAISNTLIEQEIDLEDNMKKVLFQVTPIMSTYLVAWIVGYFDVKESTIELKHKSDEPNSSNNIIVRAFTSKGHDSHAEFAIDMAKKSLQFFTHLFNLPYHLPKIDLVSVRSLDAMAMENWGCLVFQEQYFLVTENTSLPLKQRIARLIAHEICHQWFGNLVSIYSWKYLWLKVQ